ncbi:hypothetical protein OPV22_023378 [Ensete ventricosum]|uniref:Uncharacterized protein n=1 Tax=Ensete ventricosum TaxID=4639 RepID=A0AAV8QM16_ENSVE|nr:hypothetical protein OPV22_023378 [Ensete ventricosum]
MSSSHGTGSRSCTEAEGGNDIARDRTDPMCAQPPRTVYQRRAIIITLSGVPHYHPLRLCPFENNKILSALPPIPRFRSLPWRRPWRASRFESTRRG